MKTNKELTKQIVTALEKYNESEKTMSDKIFLKSALLAVVPEIGTIYLDGEYLTHTDYERECLCGYLDEMITIDEEIPSHITAVFSSGSIGYGILGDSYDPLAI